MVIDIKMCRFESVPWGFRLVGGSDFEYPLTVVKVTEGSIADNAGLKVGDIIVRINDTAASPLSHDESNRIIKGCGNVFFLGVQRENEEEYTVPKSFPTSSVTGISTPTSFRDVTALPSVPIILDQRGEVLEVDDGRDSRASWDAYDLPEPRKLWRPSEYQYSTCSEPIDSGSDIQYMPELQERPCSVLSDTSERKLVEDEIAAVLSGESEILKQHDTIGLFPKPGVCMSSDVLRTLNEEATKTKLEKEQENRRWTTFLQKPDRPIPMSKAQIEAERRAANAYKVKIVKSAPRSSRSVSPAPVPRIETPPPVQAAYEPEPEIPTPNDTVVECEPEPEAPTPIDTEVPNLEEIVNKLEPSTDLQTDDVFENEKSDKEKECTPETKETEEEQYQVTSDEAELVPEILLEENKPTAVTAKTAEELELERQLADVQRQLAALSNLPSTIQSTLDSVTRQLADLLPSFKLQQEKQKSPEAREISLEKIEHQSTNQEFENDINTDIKQCDNEPENCHESVKSSAHGISNQGEEEDNKANEQIANGTNEARDTIDKNPIKQQEATTANSMRTEEETHQMVEEQKLKKQKKQDVIGELEEHLERKSNPKRSKRAFGPLTPASDRPLVLPGGRRWYRPKDAYNDEFIAETLSAQAELITGSTLGVNFMKYQKPEKKIDLNRSEVYKVIHHLDRQPVRGIEVRPPIVPSEADVRKAAQS